MDAYTVMDTMMMGHTVLWDIMKQREELYAKEDFTDEDGLKVSELEEKFAELDGWNAESDAAALLSGLGIKEDKHYVLMGSRNNGASMMLCWRRLCMAIRITCCWTSLPMTWTWKP